tara:strand:+ start:67 stop:252 length:186 start_codon:yes stop_codon:yes gene_type:complete
MDRKVSRTFRLQKFVLLVSQRLVLAYLKQQVLTSKYNHAPPKKSATYPGFCSRAAVGGLGF